MTEQDNSNSDQPKYLTHEDLNGALKSQKKDFEKIMAQQSQQFTSLLESFNKNFGPPPEKQALPTKQELSDDTSSLKNQIKILMEERETQQKELKQQRKDQTIRDNLNKHGIKSRADVALKFVQDQVFYDEDGQLAMNVEITPGVIQPLPLGEAVAKFAQTEHGKFLADPKDLRGSGSRSISAPGSRMNDTVTSLITGNSADPPMFKTAKELKEYATAVLSKNSIKY